jgi:phage tail protein X
MSALTKLKVTYNPDGSANYVTFDGDVVGLLCCRHYGHEWDTTEAVLSANLGLSSYGALLPAGVSVLLPVVNVDAMAESRSNTINLYD